MRDGAKPERGPELHAADQREPERGPELHAADQREPERRTMHAGVDLAQAGALRE